jgi:hypothetical protein
MRRMGECVSVSHRPHGIRCVENQSTRVSARTLHVDKHAKKMATVNTMSLSKGQLSLMFCIGDFGLSALFATLSLIPLAD